MYSYKINQSKIIQRFIRVKIKGFDVFLRKESRVSTTQKVKWIFLNTFLWKLKRELITDLNLTYANVEKILFRTRIYCYTNFKRNLTGNITIMFDNWLLIIRDSASINWFSFSRVLAIEILYVIEIPHLDTLVIYYTYKVILLCNINVLEYIQLNHRVWIWRWASRTNCERRTWNV